MKRVAKEEKRNPKLQVDCIVLALPDSRELGQVFIDLGVEHVIAFEFEDSVE